MSQLKIDVIILPEAQNDILRFYHFYLETANKLVAADAVNTITDKLDILKTDPLSGRFYQDSQYGLDYYELLIFLAKPGKIAISPFITMMEKNPYGFCELKMREKAVIAPCQMLMINQFQPLHSLSLPVST